MTTKFAPLIIALLFVSHSAFAGLPKTQMRSVNLSAQEIDYLFSHTSPDYNFDGILKLAGCSGSLIRFENSLPTDKAIAMTNGHCLDYQGDMMPYELYLYNSTDSALLPKFTFLTSTGEEITASSARSTKLLYATMTHTDLALFELEYTYEQVEQRYESHALTLSTKRPSLNEKIRVLSGYWRRGYECSIDRFVYELREDVYHDFDTMRYTTECDTIHGTSGSPVISRATGKIVGINSTGNDSGERCTMDNPCEVTEDGEISVYPGRNYGEQTYQIYSCLNVQNKIDLTVPGCALYH